MKRGKRETAEGTESNQECIKTLGEKESYNSLAILEVNTIKQVEMKEKIRKECLRIMRKFLKIKLSSRNLIKGINT